MNNDWLSADDLQTASWVEREALLRGFAHTMTSLSGAMNRLHAFARERRSQLADGVDLTGDQDIALTTWLLAIRQAGNVDPSRFSKEASLNALEDWFFSPRLAD